MPAPKLLQQLLTAIGPSGHEVAAGRAWREGCKAFATDVAADHLGSSRARVPGTANGPTLGIFGHIDEIALHVTHVDDGGFVRFGQVGGWDAAVLVSQRVRLFTKEGPIRGVIGRKPVHLLKEDERKKVPELKALHIDIGARDGDEARSLVRVGDVAVIDAEPIELLGDRIVSRALDDRVGCYVAAEAARRVAESGGAPGDVVAVAAVQEETSFAGSQTSAFALQPDVAITVEVTHATDQPGVELGELTQHPLGSGAVIARGTALHPRVSELLYEVAAQEKIPFTLESIGRRTGTDVDAIHLSRAGIPTGLVSVPLRYMHSPVEMVSLQDIEAAARLIASFAQRLEPGISFER